MSRFYKYLTTAITNGFYWALDYVYIAYRQCVGLLRPGDAHKYSVAKIPHAPVVILLPGIYEKWHFMQPLAEVLWEQGYAVHVIEGLGYNRGSIEAMARLTQEYITQSNIKSCVIVAHSKGGLIGKYLLVHNNEQERIKGLVALNTPFSGSKYASLMPLRSLQIFKPNAPSIVSLANNNLVNAHIVSMYSTFDPHVPAGSHLEGAQNLQVATRGHFRIINNKHVHQAVLRHLGHFFSSK